MSGNSKLKKISFKELELRQLRSFCLAATQRNFATAAQELGLSRPAVWQQVRALERQLGTTLLQRRGRTVELTPEGQLLLELVEPHVNGLDSLGRLFESRREQLQQYLTVASTLYIAGHQLVAPIREFSSTHPHVRVRLLQDVWHQEAARLVERGQADLAVVPCEIDVPRSPHLDYQDLFEMDFLLLHSTRHPLARKQPIRPADIVRCPMIVVGAGPSQRALDQLLQKDGLGDQVRGVMELDSSDLIMKYVAAGVGIALLYLDAREAFPPGVQKVKLDPGRRGPSCCILSRKGAHMPKVAEEFIQVVRTMLPAKV